MYSMNRVLATQRICTLLAGLLVLGGCATGPKSIEIRAAADQVINRDAAGRPLSVVVHIYQLKDSGEFSKLTFDTVASGRPLAELIGKDVLGVDEVMLVPGSAQIRTEKIHQDAKHIGIVAFFRQPDQHYWRMLVDADRARSGGINFRVQDCFLSLTSPKPDLIPGQLPTPPLSCGANNLGSASDAATSTGTLAYPGGQVAQGKRSGASETARQGAEAFPARKP